jgi:hypothetical protein
MPISAEPRLPYQDRRQGEAPTDAADGLLHDMPEQLAIFETGRGFLGSDAVHEKRRLEVGLGGDSRQPVRLLMGGPRPVDVASSPET